MLESTEGYTLDVGVGALGEFGMFDGELEMWSRTFTIRLGRHLDLIPWCTIAKYQPHKLNHHTLLMFY